MQNKTVCFVGFDTSNYTTSAAVCTEDGKVIANIKSPLPVEAGACGLRQSDAVFAHLKNLPDVCEVLRAVTADYTVAAVGYSAYPRDAEGSYMPCFLAGKTAATSFAAALGVPLYAFSHQNGHIMAAAYASGQMEKLMQGPFVAFHVSGGTTEAVLVTPEHGSIGKVTLVGETADLNAGQAIDRIGVAMGLSFPCGRAIELLAANATGKIPKPRVSVKGSVCNLSGLENLALKLYTMTGNKELVSAYTLDFVAETLSKMTENILSEYGRMPVLYAGGVMSNCRIRERLERKFHAYFGAPAFSADNAAGTSLLCRNQFLKGE